MEYQEFKDTLHDWRNELISNERNSGLHTTERAAAIVKSFIDEYTAMLAFVEELQQQLAALKEPQGR